MFALHSITLTNFRSYRGTHEFTFPDKAGLYYFSGVNQVDDLGSNGAGKSTFMDAITWVLFGRTARGLKANEVVTWGGTGCAVTLELTIGRRMQVQRTQKPNGLFLNAKPVDQEELEKHIRLNCDSFLHSVLNAQFGESFFSLAPSAKLTLFSDIMTLNFWLGKSEEAAKLSQELVIEIEGLQRSSDQLSGQLVSVKADITELEPQVSKFARDTKGQIEHLKLEKLHLEHDIQEMDNARIDIANELNKHRKALLQFKGTLTFLESKLEKSLAAIQSGNRDKARIAGEISIFQQQFDKFKNMGDVCPHCLQDVDSKHLKDERLVAVENMEFRNGALRGIEEIIQFQIKQMMQHRNNIAAKESKAEVVVIEQAQLSFEDGKLESRLKTATHKRHDVKDKIEALLKATNPFGKMLAEKRKLYSELKASLADLKATKAAQEAQHSAISFWVKGFKRIRLFIIEQAFQVLEIEVNNSLAQLGMPDWQITFDIERENKSGGITKGFVVFVKSPSNKEPVRWENWSGGETQRLQLAGDLGLANLIMTQAGLTNSVEFYDEASTHLSPEGMIDLAKMLHERAINEDKRIWIIDHGAITNFGDFEGIITVRKDSNGSEITYAEN